MESSGAKFKMIRISFSSLDHQDEMKIRQFLNQALLKGTVVLMESKTKRGNLRADFRVLTDLKAVIQTQGSVRLPPETITVRVTDISVGGACVVMNVEQQVIKNGAVRFIMDFIEKDFSIEAKVLGLKTRT